MKRVGIIGLMILIFIPFLIVYAGWQEDVRLTYDDASSLTSDNNARCVAVDTEENIFVTWYDNRNGDYEIYYKMWDGFSWGEDIPLTENDGSSQAPSIAIDVFNNIHIVWQDNSNGYWEIYYKERTSSGWLPEIILGSSASNANYNEPCVAAGSNGEIHVVWASSSESRILYKKRGTNLEWEDAIEIGSATYPATPSVIADDHGNIYVVWHGYVASNGEIYFNKYLNGQGWQAQTRLTNDNANSVSPSISVSFDCIIHVVWNDNAAGNDNYELNYSRYEAEVWTPIERLTFASGDSWESNIATAQNGNTHLVWCDERDGNIEIYDIHGRKVETFMQGEQPAGYHQITWDASDVPSGIYFYRIQAGEYAETKKMIFVK